MKFIFGLLAGLVRFVFHAILLAFVLALLAVAGFIYFKGNQPMQVAQVPAGMTYWQFMSDRLDAAQEVEPKRCGVGRLVTFGVLAPVYSVVYANIGLHPGGFLDRISQDDQNIPTGVEDILWHNIPDLWWKVFEKISWSMLARHTPACNFRPVEIAGH
ncbi:MAG: hypothetical protein GYA58_05745 [Anaerolineaceae bacterium]|nr:hypothetical protein [Anaerolineaceae bacterium]